MLDRTPSTFMQLMSNKSLDVVRGISSEGAPLGEADWTSLYDALTHVEYKLSNDERWMYKTVNLGEKSEFDTHVVPVLEYMGIESGKHDAYHSVLSELKRTVVEDGTLDDWVLYQ